MIAVHTGGVEALSLGRVAQVAAGCVLACVAAAAQQTTPALPDAPAPRLIEHAAPAQVTVLEDTLIRVITSEAISTRHVADGTPLVFTVSEDVRVGDALAIPRGAIVHGTVVRAKKAGTLAGSPALTIKLTSLDLGGRTYPLYSYQFKVTGISKTQPTETKVGRGAAIGALVGASAVAEKGGVTATSRAASSAVGAVAGAGVGTLVAAASPGPDAVIPSESQMDFYLAVPVTVAEVSAREAEKLAEGLHRGGPSLYVRGETP